MKIIRGYCPSGEEALHTPGRFRSLRSFLVASLVALAASPVSAETAASRNPNVDSEDVKWATVRVNVPGHLSDAAIFIARDMGYFEQEKIRLEESRSTAPDSIPLLASGQLDVTGGAVSVGFLNALARGIPIKIVADKGSLRDGFSDYAALVVPPSAAGASTTDILRALKGKKVGSNCVACAMEYMVAGYLSAAGMTIDDIDLVPLSGPAQLLGVKNGSIAAAHMLEPAITQAIATGIGAPVLTPSEVGQNGAASAVLMYSAKFGSTDAARRFMRAYLRGARDYTKAFFAKDADMREKVINILLKSTTVKDRSLFDTMRYAYIDPNGEINIDSLNSQQAYYVSSNKLPKDKTIEFKGVVDTSFTDAAVSSLGRWEAAGGR